MRDITKQAREILEGQSLVTEPRTEQERKERARAILVLYSKGMSLVSIGQIYGISRQRVSQIMYENGMTPSAKRESNKLKKLEENNKALTEKLGSIKDVYSAKLRTLREKFSKEHLRVISLQKQLDCKNKKLEKVENYSNELRTLQLKIANLSSCMARKDKKIKELEEKLEMRSKV